MEPELRESWFNKEAPVSLPPPSSLLPPPPPPRRGPRLVLGAATGAGAGAAAMIVAKLVAQRTGASPDPLELAGRLAGHTSWGGFVVAAVCGAPLGALLAIMLMHGSRFVTRAIVASAFSVAVWFCVHLLFVARHAAAPPLVPMLAGAGLYGMCIAVLPRAKR